MIFESRQREDGRVRNKLEVEKNGNKSGWMKQWSSECSINSEFLGI